MARQNLSPHARFDQWCGKLPANTTALVEQVLQRVVPEFESRGFGWYSDYGGGDLTQVGMNEIPLQRRSGSEWATVGIRFDKRGRPSCALDFAMLPPTCRRWTGEAYIEIPRERAVLVDAPARFGLCDQSKRDYYCQFGYRWFAFSPSRKISSEVDRMIRLLPALFRIFDTGVPSEWVTHGFGFVAPQVMNLSIPGR